MQRAVVILCLLIASTGHALPPGAAERGFRDGANHHVGDDSFVARFGRAPGPDDGEHARMHVHLAYIHDRLAAGAPTRPELAATRTRMLGYLADYLAAGITPVNTYVPWRSPVFIDAAGNICAVGYLIERSAGRELAETIARAHRLDFLEDIAAAMPEVAAWVEGSGFTLDELASIQPGYMGPGLQFATGWVATNETGEPVSVIKNGVFSRVEEDGTKLTGRFANKRMTGSWKLVDSDGKLVGSGVFTAGAGTWRSRYPDGKRMAEGAYANNVPNGRWRLFHPSGRLAAEGRFARGRRHGAWQFFQDTDRGTPIAEGRFSAGAVAGTWRHFDPAGKLLAVARDAVGEPPGPDDTDGGRFSDGTFIRVMPGRGGVTHEVHGGIPVDDARLEGFYLGAERIYQERSGATYDGSGHTLIKVGDAWQERDCGWSAARKKAARTGDVTALHVLLLREKGGGDCLAPRPIEPARSKRIDAMLATRSTVRSPTPAFVRAYFGHSVTSDYGDGNDDDLASVLAAHMAWYIEWPHIDEPFVALYRTLPGFIGRVN